MAPKRPLADLDDLTQEEQHFPDVTRRSSYPAASTTANHPHGASERHVQQSMMASRSARTLPLPSPTWFSPTNAYPSPRVPPAWDLQGPQGVLRQSSQRMFVGSTSGDALRALQVDYSSLVKKDPCSPLSGLDSDDATQVLTRESAKPESERQHLKAEIGLLQAQIEDLQQQMDLFKQHGAQKDAQYLQIIEQSTRREVQSLTDRQRWQEDRKQWADERQMLQDTIVGLNTKLGELRTGYSQQGRSSESLSAQVPIQSSLAAATEPSGITSSQQHTKQSSITSVPEHQPPSSGAAAGTPLDQLQYESGQLAEYSMRLVEIGRKIRVQLDVMKGG